MDAVNLHTMVNLTGGSGEDLAAAVASFDRAFPRRFVSMTEPHGLVRARPATPPGRRRRLPRPRQRARWASRSSRRWARICGTAGPRGRSCAWTIPVSIRCGMPAAVSVCLWRCTSAIPRRSSCRSTASTSATRSSTLIPTGPSTARTSRHSRRSWTRGIGSSPASKDDVRGAARRPLGRKPRRGRRDARQVPERARRDRRTHRRTRPPAATAASFFDRYQDRVLFGTDAIPLGIETPQQVFGEDLYRIYYRFLETRTSTSTTPRRRAPAGPMADLRHRAPGTGAPQGVLPERRAGAGVEAGRRVSARNPEKPSWLPASAGRMARDPPTRRTASPTSQWVACRRRSGRQPSISFGNPHASPSKCQGTPIALVMGTQGRMEGGGREEHSMDVGDRVVADSQRDGAI